MAGWANRRWIAPMGVCLAFLLLAGMLSASTRIAGSLIVAAAIMASVAAWELIRMVRVRTKYDLGALREFHEKEELRQLDPGEVAEDADTVICLCCGGSRPRRIAVCPYCRS